MGYEAGQGETAGLAQEATCPRPAGPGQKPAPQASPPQSRPSFPHLRRTPQPPPPAPGPDPSPSPCSYLGCASGVSLKKLRFDRALLLLSIAANLPQLLIWHSRLPHSADLASSPCFPAPSLHAFSAPGSLLWEAAPDCPQVEGHPWLQQMPGADGHVSCFSFL